ncbi:MAG TPA: DUF2142 domain-containing protein [Solirubrobacteraceae bacterium]|nr:DUF2142 domain-containing protein [Solirubrobacteraceae bacterium]
MCAAVAILNAFCWSVITPPFQVSDEPSHFAYVKQFAEPHELPHSHELRFSREEEQALIDLDEFPVSILPATGAVSSRAQQQRLAHDLAAAAEEPREGSDAAGVATSQPPLYYLLETVPYEIASGSSLLARLTLMRLLSALFAGVTAMFAFLFVRETLPATHAAWTAGGLSVAFAPLLGFMSGAVNPDSLLFAVSAAAFWSLARAFRRGLTYRRASVIGAITAVGLLTKLNFAGLFPGVMLGLGILAWHLARRSRARAWRAFALGVGIAISPVVPYVLINLTHGTPTFGLFSGATSVAAHHGSIFAAFSYVWQVFLPRLPGMTAHFSGISTTRQIWFDGLVGQYGWVETAFPEWLYELAAVFAVALVVACARTLFMLRGTARERIAELVVYAIMSIGLLVLVGAASYISPLTEQFTEARYLLPLLALFAAGVGLAIRAAGRRWEHVLAAVVVLAMIADTIFSQLLVIGRYYS